MSAANAAPLPAGHDPDRLDWETVRDGHLQPVPADAGTSDND